MERRITTKKQEELVVQNLNLVYHFVNKLGVDFKDYDDMVSVGKIGLINAAITFDSSKGIAFSTYASVCIKNVILRHLERENSHKNINLTQPIADHGMETIERIIKKETAANCINIILNCLKAKNRNLMLYVIAYEKHDIVAKKLNTSRRNVSKKRIKIIRKIKDYLISTKQFKTVFSMAIVGESYQISFSTKDVGNFNKIFAKMLKNLTSIEDLPDFKIDCNKERVTIKVPAKPESFSFIAQIIQEIENFNMTLISD